MQEHCTPKEFLELLWSSKPEQLYILLWTLQDKRSHWCRSIEEAAAMVGACRRMDLYTGVGLSPADFGPHDRCPADKIAGLAGQWSDFDLFSEAHNKPLPRTIPEALSLVPASFEPTIVISTGNGAHAWWLCKEPQIFETEEERKEASALAVRFQTMFRAKAASRGWTFDRLADLPRVLRIPGTTNWKDPANPKPVAVYSYSGRRYNPSDFEELLDEMGVPGPEAQERTAQEWAQRFADKALVINLEAKIPEETLKGWREQDLRFRNTWLRQRHDLEDQSQSGYDMALADFGASAGLTEQQIVDLIVHHRRIHAQRARTRMDYFERTIGKALIGRGDSGAVDITMAPEQPAAGAQSNVGVEGQPVEEQADPAVAKAILCEQLSGILGVRIIRILKIIGKEPTYQLELENAKIEFSNLGKLINQNYVRVAIGSAVDRLIPRIKPKRWEEIAQMMLDALVVEEGGEEVDFVGATRMYLHQYLAETPFIAAIEGQPSQSARKPTILNNQIAISAGDLQQYVNKTFSQNYSVKAIASMLAALGAKSVRLRGSTFRSQSRWILPTIEFDPEEFAAPATEAGAGRE